MEELLISGVASDKNTANFCHRNRRQTGNKAFKIFNTLAKKNINVDIILQSVGRETVQRYFLYSGRGMIFGIHWRSWKK